MNLTVSRKWNEGDNVPTVRANQTEKGKRISMEIVKETAYSEAYWQAYQQTLDAGYDIRVARAEAMNAEKNAKAAARKAERMRKKTEQAAQNSQAKKAKKQMQDTGEAFMPEKGAGALSRVKLFAEVREGKTTQVDVIERLQQVQEQPLYHRAIPKELTPAQKKYLLTMYHLDSYIVKQVDIAEQLGVTKASTHKVVHDLIELGMVERYDRCSIALSEKGLFAAVNLNDCYSAIVDDLLRRLSPEQFRQQRQKALEVVLKMPVELVQEILQNMET